MNTINAPIYTPGQAPKVYLRCACCGGFAGYFEQHWNQDLGWGLCAPCARWIAGRLVIRERMTPTEAEADMRRTYGEPGINRAEPERVTT